MIEKETLEIQYIHFTVFRNESSHTQMPKLRVVCEMSELKDEHLNIKDFIFFILEIYVIL